MPVARECVPRLQKSFATRAHCSASCCFRGQVRASAICGLLVGFCATNSREDTANFALRTAACAGHTRTGRTVPLEAIRGHVVLCFGTGHLPSCAEFTLHSLRRRGQNSDRGLHHRAAPSRRGVATILPPPLSRIVAGAQACQGCAAHSCSAEGKGRGQPPRRGSAAGIPPPSLRRIVAGATPREGAGSRPCECACDRACECACDCACDGSGSCAGIPPPCLRRLVAGAAPREDAGSGPSACASACACACAGGTCTGASGGRAAVAVEVGQRNPEAGQEGARLSPQERARAQRRRDCAAPAAAGRAGHPRALSSAASRSTSSRDGADLRGPPSGMALGRGAAMVRRIDSRTVLL
mmetsp:Transcript_49648/g.160509  ORF Transcript_49648/g.160509 Transcript_49648/m.160509 type:complete len:354 (-) Transcript_49648:280-1341(-)